MAATIKFSPLVAMEYVLTLLKVALLATQSTVSVLVLKIPALFVPASNWFWKGINVNKVKEEPKIVVTEETRKKEEKNIVGHSTKKVGSFFADIVNKTRDWISDDVE